MKRNKDLSQIVIATILGTVIGGVCSIIYSGHLHWLGPLIGAFIGFIACVPREVWSTAAQVISEFRVLVPDVKMPSRSKICNSVMTWVMICTLSCLSGVWVACSFYSWEIFDIFIRIYLTEGMNLAICIISSMTFFGAFVFLAKPKSPMIFPIVNIMFPDQSNDQSTSIWSDVRNFCTFQRRVEGKLFRSSVVLHFAVLLLLAPFLPFVCFLYGLWVALELILTLFLALATTKRMASMLGSFCGSLCVLIAYRSMDISAGVSLTIGVVLAVTIAVGFYLLRQTIEAKAIAMATA